MAHITPDRTVETAPANGTADFALAGAVDTFRAFSASMANTDTTYYFAYLATVGFEVALGTKAAGTLARPATVLAGSNGTARVNFGSSGNVTVAAGIPAVVLAMLVGIYQLSPSNDDVLQRKAGAWTNRTMGQLAADVIPAWGVGANDDVLQRKAGVWGNRTMAQLLADIGPAIAALTEDTAPVGSTDWILTGDASASNAPKKVLLHHATAFKVGTFTRDISLASGTQAITGVGFVPKAIIFMMSVNATDKAGWAMSDAFLTGGIYDLNSFVAGGYGPNAQLRVISGGINDVYDGYPSSMDSDGFTMTWTKTGSPTGTATIKYLAFR